MSSLDSEESWDEEGWEDNECALYRCFFANKEFETPLKALLYDQNVTDGAFDFLDWIESVCFYVFCEETSRCSCSWIRIR